jgi:hypothetical protein
MQLSLPLSPSLSLSLIGEQGSHTLFTDQTDRERERERAGEREREREKERETCPELLFLLFKGVTGALAPFSYLVI